MIKFKKRNGKIEEFIESKIITGVKKAGASDEEAELVAKEVSLKVAHKADINAEELSNIVVTSLRKANKAAAEKFVKFRDNKLEVKKQKITESYYSYYHQGVDSY